MTINEANELTRFKRGWSDATRTVYFWGRIIDGAKFEELTREAHPAPGIYPAYRSGEFSDEP